MEISSVKFWMEIIVAICCGGIIGLERQLRGKPAGIRTSIMICLGSSIFISLGAAHSGGNTDFTRVLSQVVTGIGFLGAGVIIGHDGLVKGITSASVIWVLAGIGAMIGFGHFAEAFITAVITVFILSGINFIEKKMNILQSGDHAQYVEPESGGSRSRSLSGSRK